MNASVSSVAKTLLIRSARSAGVVISIGALGVLDRVYASGPRSRRSKFCHPPTIAFIKRKSKESDGFPHFWQQGTAGVPLPRKAGSAYFASPRLALVGLHRSLRHLTMHRCSLKPYQSHPTALRAALRPSARARGAPAGEHAIRCQDATEIIGVRGLRAPA